LASYSYELVVYKAKVFTLLILSSLGFSVGLVLARMSGDESLLPKVLNYQSVVVLSSFVLQLGCRAALRMHFYNNRHRLVEITESFLYMLLFPLMLIGIFFEVYFDIYIYIASSSAMAFITLKLTLSVARNSLRVQFLYATINFTLCVVGSLFFIFETESISANLMIEISAVFIMMTACGKANFSGVRRRLKAIFAIVYRAQSYQLGAGVISLMVFCLTQSMILGYSNSTVMVAFADTQIGSGFLWEGGRRF